MKMKGFHGIIVYDQIFNPFLWEGIIEENTRMNEVVMRNSMKLFQALLANIKSRIKQTRVKEVQIQRK